MEGEPIWEAAVSIDFKIYNPRQNPVFPTDNQTTGAQYQQWLEQYYSLRERCFRRDLGVDDFDGSEEVFDRIGYTLLIIADNICVGGVRLNESTSEYPYLLPLESDGFMLRRVFPQLNELGIRFSQWTRLAVHDNFRSSEVIGNLAKHMSKMYRALGHDYGFNVSGSNRARFYRRLHSSQGHSSEIRKEVQLPVDGEFSHLEHLLSVVYVHEEAKALVYQPCRDHHQQAEAILHVA